VNLLGIETSCDETGVALIRCSGSDTPELVAQALHSQVALHADYGGVVPELASRDHVRRVVPLTASVLDDVGLSVSELDAIAYTRGPGLAGARLVGAGVACSLAAALGRPAIAIHHLEGHLLSPFLSANPPAFPFIALLVSGGHTQLLEVADVGRYTLLGDTIDDAAGEAFDKSAKLLGLGYPGGPALARLAEFGDPEAYALPRPLLQRDSLDFSFAGLKTAVRTHAARFDSTCEQARADLAASTQAAIVDVLARKSMAALAATGCGRLVVAGGVGANAALRGRLLAECEKRQARVHFPELALCTDNGAMIALAAAMRWQRGIADISTDYTFDVRPRWPLVAA
jgi:tRNA N6-adenosine threonylcarbamoyltransferase